jgi:hypothetical protein
MLKLTAETDKVLFIQSLEQLSKKNGVHVEGLSLSTETGVPNIGISIWFGSFPAKWASNIQSLKKNNPFNHILFMDKEIFETLSSKNKEEIISFCQTNQLFLIFYQDVFEEKDELETKLFPILNRARHEGNYGAASDVLRVLVLRRFGGLYFDTDCWVTSKFLPEQFSSTHINIHTAKSGAVCNDILAIPLAKKAMDDLERVCHSILKTEQRKFEDRISFLETGRTTHDRIIYEENYLSLPYHFIRREDTIRSTGPYRFMPITTKPISDQEKYDGKNVFYTRCALTWISGTRVFHEWTYIDIYNRKSSIATWSEYQLPIKKDQQELLAHLDELLSYYSENEPRTIRFDFFRLDILQVFAKENVNIEPTLLQGLLEHKSTEERQQIEYIAFALFDSFAVNYPLLFDVDYFPHLKREAYLPEIATLIKMNDEKAISFFEQHHKDLYTAACQFNEDPAPFNSDKILQRFIANKTSGHNEIADLIGFNLLGQHTQLNLPLILQSIQGEMSFHKNLLNAKRNNTTQSEGNVLYLNGDASYHVLTLLDEHTASSLLEQRLLLNFSHAENYKKLFTLLEQNDLSTNQRNYLTFCFQQELAERPYTKERILLQALSLEHYQFCKTFGLTSLELHDFSEIPWCHLANIEEYDQEILTWIATKIRKTDFGHFLFNEIGHALDGKQQPLFAILDAANRHGEIAEVLKFYFSPQSKTISRLEGIAKYCKEGKFLDVFSKLTCFGFHWTALYDEAVKFENHNLLNALIELGVNPTAEVEQTDKKPSFPYARFHTTNTGSQNTENDPMMKICP